MNFPNTVWLNPQNPAWWDRMPSIKLMREIMENRMFPLTLRGLDDAMRALT